MTTMLRYGKFTLVGALGMGVQLGVLALTNRLFPGHFLAASAVAVEAAVIQNFFWHLRVTWRDRRHDLAWAMQFWRFQLSNGAVSLLGNLVLMSLFLRVARLPLVLANTFAIACCSLANFWLAEVWAFGRSGHRPPARIAWVRKSLPLLIVLLLASECRAQIPVLQLPREGGLGTDCAYVNWFVGPAATTGGTLSLNSFTGGLTFGQYFARTYGHGVVASPQFELGLVGPLPRGANVDGLFSVNAMFANRIPRRTLYPSATLGYTRMFVTGNAVNFGVGIDFGKDGYKRLLRVELRDYYLFTGPRQHVFGIRFGLGKFVSD